MTEEQVRELVWKKAKPSWAEWARANGIPKSRVTEFMQGLRPPNDKLLNALGLERRIVRIRALKKGSDNG